MEEDTKSCPTCGADTTNDPGHNHDDDSMDDAGTDDGGDEAGMGDDMGNGGSDTGMGNMGMDDSETDEDAGM